MPERGAIWVGMWWNLTLTGDGVYFRNLTRYCFCLIFIDFGDKCWIYIVSDVSLHEFYVLNYYFLNSELNFKKEGS